MVRSMTRLLPRDIAEVMVKSAAPLDMIGATHHGDLGIIMPDVGVREAADRLREMSTRAASMVTQAQGLSIRPVTMVGFVDFERKSQESSETVVGRAVQAAVVANSTCSGRLHSTTAF